MRTNRLKLLGLSLLVALAVYSTPTYQHAKASNCDTLTLIRPRLLSAPYLNYTNARATTLESIERLQQRDTQVLTIDESTEVFSPMSDALNREALRKYSQLSELSKVERNASFSLMTAEDKSSMWRVHFRLNLARHPEWTEKQRAIVLEAVAMATPDLYKEVPKDNTWTRLVEEPVRLFTQRALLVFSKQEGAALFSQLGLNEQSESNHAQPSTAKSCTCSQESDWCTYQCASTECTVLTWGCGTLGIYACNGKCSSP